MFISFVRVFYDIASATSGSRGPGHAACAGASHLLVTPAMMSILGATPEDMEEILKGLGYRGEPKAESEVKARLEEFEAEARAKALRCPCPSNGTNSMPCTAQIITQSKTRPSG